MSGSSTVASRLPTYFISHGGGPWPWLDGDFRRNFDTLESALKDMPRQLGRKPAAVLVISGHWETPQFSVMAATHPTMIYDYSGFPEHTYHIRYAAPGSPALARRVQGLLQAAGIPAGLDEHQGFDHGTFVPLAVIYPEADVPVVQLSLKAGYDPAAHLAAGRALVPLRDENVLIVGSGLSYHNLRQMGPGARAPSKEFDDWLQRTLVGSSPGDREKRLIEWEKAPAARQSHPREDHLIPLMVAVGAAGRDAATCVYHEETLFGGTTASSFRFDAVS
jgi:aromatic ring-opening dioxygenase catalytic subunit (LigB family)